MKRWIAIVVCLLLTATMLTGVAASAELIEVKTAADLNAVRNNLSGNYILKNDITFTESDFAEGGAFYNNGKGFIPIGNENSAFTGTFDGGGFTVTGLCITASCNDQDDSLYAGLFGNVGGTESKTAVIRNLTLKNVNLSFTIPQDVSGISVLETDIGGICAVCGEYTTVENCAVSGNISATVSVSTTVKVGGIAGSNYGTISNCCGTASVSGQSPWKVYVGGIAGYQHGILEKCWANAPTDGSATYTFCGTLVGYSVNVNTTDCYYADHGADAFGHVKSTESATLLSLPVTAEQLIGWDTETVWTIDADEQPMLRDPNCTHTVSKDVILQAATCVASGSKNVICEHCNMLLSKNVTVAPTGNHQYGQTPLFDETGHWNKCVVCLTETAVSPHSFDNDCDATCNECDYIRTPSPHQYDNACDADCNVCGATRTPSPHQYDNACDADCNVCGATRTPSPHQYDNACDADCNVCGATRTPSPHQYDNDCDATCNECGAVRTPPHSYQTEWSHDETYHWHECSGCHDVIDRAEHDWDDGEIITVPTYEAAGVCRLTCKDCLATKDVEIPMLQGDLFVMTLPTATVSKEESADLYTIGWQLQLSLSEDSALLSPEYDYLVLRYGIVCAADEQTLLNYMAGETPEKIITCDFGKQSGEDTPLTKIYRVTNYQLTKVKENKERYAVCFIIYEVNGTEHTQYTEISHASTVPDPFNVLDTDPTQPIGQDDELEN